MNVHQDNIWKLQGTSTSEEYVAHFNVAGVSNISVYQKGRNLTVSGSNPTLKIEYNYNVKLHSDSCGDPRIDCKDGLCTIYVRSYSSIDRRIYGEVVAGCAPLIECKVEK